MKNGKLRIQTDNAAWVPLIPPNAVENAERWRLVTKTDFDSVKCRRGERRDRTYSQRPRRNGLIGAGLMALGGT